MKTYQLKINMANLKKEVERDYFKYKDIFYKCLIGNINLFNILHFKNPTISILDDSHYNQFYLYSITNGVTIEKILQDIDSPYNVSIFLDTNMYYEEFIRLRHSDKHINLYSLHIDDLCNVIVTNKHLTKNA